MESVLSANDKQSMISSFLEIAVGQTAETARQFLQATSWKLEEAIQLFYVGNEGGAVERLSNPSQIDEGNAVGVDDNANVSRNENGNENIRQQDLDEVRAPLPVRREVLYDDAILYPGLGMGRTSQDSSSLMAFRNFDEEMKHPGVWESDQGSTSNAENARDNLASLYRPPFHLMYRGSFEKAKGTAAQQDKWLLVNLQSTREFSSHMLNRDTWANEAVSQTIKTNFIFWQVYDDTSEGQKVCTYYRLDSIPVVLVIDPITGQRMRSWSGMIQPESLLENLLPFMEGGPKDHHVSSSHKRPREKSLTPKQKFKESSMYAYTPLAWDLRLHREDGGVQFGWVKKLEKHHPLESSSLDEGKEEDEELQAALAASLENIKDATKATGEEGANSSIKEKDTLARKISYPPLPEEPKGDKSLLCRVGVRLPDGRRVQRNFLRTEPVQLLWSFCCSQLPEAESRPFRLAQAIPGASKSLDYDSKSTFEESGLANSMISFTWE